MTDHPPLRQPDTDVCCEKCKKRKVVNFSLCLRYGWPECCGSTMSLIRTDANIEFSTRQAITEQLQ